MYNEILKYVRKHVRDINSARDIVQDTFLDYSKCTAEIKDIRAYLYRVATSKIVDWKRDRNKRIAITGIDVSQQTEVNHDLLHAAIATLSRNEQAAIKAVYFDGLSTAEAATNLGLNHNTLRTYLARGREKIKILI